MITRFAPTPSGYLHLGNAVNALLVDWMARRLDGTVHLRIDDLDAARSRPAYVQDVFDVLAWLGIEWSSGPRDAAEVARAAADPGRLRPYRDAMYALVDSSLETYACACPRSALVGPPRGGCPGDCRTAGYRLTPGRTALRVHVPPGTSIDEGGATVDLEHEVGDVVVWRRDDLPAYHLASVVDDAARSVTHVVRGEDLRAATAAQRFLAPHAGAAGFLDADVVHHRLLTDDAGRKLSKSQVRSGRPLERTAQSRAVVEAAALRIGAEVGINPPD